tara:strand:+ start:13278 stop:14258 length:981 start_codon:yes stop_codon:yes gene_type:complete
MKKIILIPMLIFSLLLFSQESDKKNENIRLETKIELLQQEIDVIKQTLNIKTDNTRLKLEIDSLNTIYQQIINNIKSNVNEKADILILERIEKKLVNKIDSINFNVTNNSFKLDNNNENINSIISTLNDQDINIQTTSGKVEKNNHYILLIFVLAILLLVACLFIYIQSSKNKTSILNTNEKVEKIQKLDKDLKNILENHTKVLEVSNETNSKDETLKFLKIVVDEIMTMENNIYQMTEDEKNSRGLKRIIRAIRNLRNNYKTMGYDIPQLLGTEWKEGDVIEIVSELPDENIEKGKRIITRIVTPRIDFKGEMIQRAKVELKSNI